MANETLLRDSNHIAVLGAITNDANQEIRMVRVDPVTNRILVSAPALTSGLIIGTTTITGGTTTRILYDNAGILGELASIPVANGGTGTSTVFTQGSVVFAGASGVYSQDNANFFYNSSTKAFSLGGKIALYNSISTTGYGVPAIYGSDRKTAQTAAVALATYTVGASDSSFLVSANVLVTTATLHTFTVTCSYTDEGNTARVLTLPFQLLAGTSVTSITNAQGTVPYEGTPIHIRAKAGTTIIIQSAAGGTYTTVVYNIEEFISQIA